MEEQKTQKQFWILTAWTMNEELLQWDCYSLDASSNPHLGREKKRTSITEEAYIAILTICYANHNYRRDAKKIRTLSGQEIGHKFGPKFYLDNNKDKKKSRDFRKLSGPYILSYTRRLKIKMLMTILLVSLPPFPYIMHSYSPIRIFVCFVRQQHCLQICLVSPHIVLTCS